MQTLALALASLTASLAIAREDPPPTWPQWRRPNLDGSSPARDLPTRWSAKENDE